MTPQAHLLARVQRPHAAWVVAAATMLAGLAHAAPRTPPGAPPVAAITQAAWTTPAPSLQLQVSRNTHVFYEARPWQPNDAAPWGAGVPAPRANLGLGFRTAPSGASGVKGLLRVQLSGDSTLHFRPRGGGLTVTYKSQF